jgi:rRNA maturation endonuclease Nob1
MEKAEVIRCRACFERFPVRANVQVVYCPKCGQGWRLKWFEDGSATIISPVSWVEYQTRVWK